MYRKSKNVLRGNEEKGAKNFKNRESFKEGNFWKQESLKWEILLSLPRVLAPGLPHIKDEESLKAVIFFEMENLTILKILNLSIFKIAKLEYEESLEAEIFKKGIFLNGDLLKRESLKCDNV